MNNEQIDHLFELMEVGTRCVGRRLEARDMKSVTEALNRKFAGTKGWQEKGINSIDSLTRKKDTPGLRQYEAICTRLGL